MANDPLNTYLQTFRRRAGLSQREMAGLLGLTCKSTVAKHESGESTPTLDSLICYEVLHGCPLRQLFEGRYREVILEFRERVNALLFLLEEQPSGKRRTHTIGVLKGLLGEEDDESLNPAA